jgi:[NiFe] hydrogenase assembly HybE family chaperone
MTERTACPDPEALALAARVQATFERVQRERMAGLPFVNEALRVELVGLQRWGGLWLGVLVTPWFMNLLLWPNNGDRGVSDASAAPWPQLAVGDNTRFPFPAGTFEFIAGREGELGEYLACSLFSPMFEFANHDAARQTAAACLTALFDAASAAPAETIHELEVPPTAPSTVSKRAFLRGRWQSSAPVPAGGESA